MADKPLYVFIDEGGDFNFTPSGSRFYTVSAVITHVPWEIVEETYQMRHAILSGEMHSQLGAKYLEEHLCHRLHASEDQQIIRDEFFKLIASAKYFKAHSVVIRKNRTNPVLYDPVKFYPMVIGPLLNYIFKTYKYSMLCIFIDNVPINKQKDAFQKALKSKIKSNQPQKEFCIYFPPSSSNIYLQMSDYLNWAIFRKWENDDDRSYKLIADKLGSKEFDMFKKGDTEYYLFKKTNDLLT